MSARGPDRAEFAAYQWIDTPGPEEDDVPFSFTEETPAATLRTDMCDDRYIDLAGRLNSLAARVAQLEHIIERWAADS